MKHNRSKTSLFLIELLIAIFFFSLAAAIGAQLFAISYIKAGESEKLNYATSLCSNAAEIFEAKSGEIEDIQSVIRGETEENKIFVYYNEDWEKNERIKKSSYQMEIEINGENSIVTAYIEISEIKSGEVIYSIKDQIYCAQKICEKGN